MISFLWRYTIIRRYICETDCTTYWKRSNFTIHGLKGKKHEWKSFIQLENTICTYLYNMYNAQYLLRYLMFAPVLLVVVLWIIQVQIFNLLIIRCSKMSTVDRNGIIEKRIIFLTNVNTKYATCMCVGWCRNSTVIWFEPSRIEVIWDRRSKAGRSTGENQVPKMKFKKERMTTDSKVAIQ